MKKLFTLGLCILFAHSIYAQSEDFKKFHFGLKVSSGFTWLKPDDTNLKNDGTKLSFGYGVITEFAFTENYSFVTGININANRGAIRQTSTVEVTPGTTVAVETSSKLKIQYLELPVTLKMKTNEIGMIKYFGQFGFGNSFRLKSAADVSTTVNGVKTTTDNVDINKSINLIREALIVGVGIEYNLTGSTSLIASVNYDNGFTRVGKSSIGKFYSKGVIINVGVLF
jgi:long-subunit fatty acid transport protein